MHMFTKQPVCISLYIFDQSINFSVEYYTLSCTYPAISSLCPNWLDVLPGNTEEVDVSIVDREVEEDGSCASVQPEVLFEESQLKGRLLSGAGKVLVVTPPSICRHLAPVPTPIQPALVCMHPPEHPAKRRLPFRKL